MLALIAEGSPSRQAIDAGPAMIDEFAESILDFNISELVASETFSESETAIQTVVDLLETQSKALEERLPNLPSARYEHPSESDIPARFRLQRPPRLSQLRFGPAVNSTMILGECRVQVHLSASENSVREATNTSGRWARPGGEDGEIFYAFRRRNTERFVGRESVDGTSIQAFVDGQVIVRVFLEGRKHCESRPDIVQEAFAEILKYDYGAFGFE
ncbi:MAG: hypothetical protein QNJ13_14055 [Paracoccaceae bacterium]|nr:hypothetical protein [Paracoccaceae bacterium]